MLPCDQMSDLSGKNLSLGPRYTEKTLFRITYFKGTLLKVVFCFFFLVLRCSMKFTLKLIFPFEGRGVPGTG